MKGSAYNLVQKNNQLQNTARNDATLPVRDTDSKRFAPSERRGVANVNEDARSVRTERHYDKSNRSGRSQELQGDNKSVRTTSSNNSQRQSVQSSHDFNKYQRISSSNVSQPDNLVCDNCINHKMHDDKVNDLANKRNNDRDHAQRVNENLRKQLEDEKKRHLDKLKLYQDAIDNQKNDQQRKKENEREIEAREKDKIRQALGKDDDLRARQELEQQKKQNFIHDLKDQIGLHQQLKAQREKELLDLDKQNPNLLIDDAWREPQRRLMQDYYKNNLLDQMKDKDAEKGDEKDRRRAEDDAYKRELAALKAKDELLRQKLEGQKKGIFQEELENQLQEKQQLKDLEKQIKRLEDDNYKKKIQHDNDVHLDNLFRKKKLQDEILDKLGNQINENELKKQLEKEEAKKPGLNSVPLPDKQNKCYNCKLCRHNYPLKMLNKKKKL